jgi:hypothetical protein
MTPAFRFIGRAGGSRRDTLVHDIADQVLPVVMRRLVSNTAAMSAAELRGYLRARAWNDVRAAVRRNVAERRGQFAQERELVTDVLERMVYLALREHFVPPVVSIPMPHVQLRAAA